MAQQLETKNITVAPGQLFCCQSKTKVCQRQALCIDYQDKVQSVKDTNNEFTECQTPKKKLQQLAFHLSAFMHL